MTLRFKHCSSTVAHDIGEVIFDALVILLSPLTTVPEGCSSRPYSMVRDKALEDILEDHA